MRAELVRLIGMGGVLLVLLPSPLSAVVRKCSNPDVPGWALMIDGGIVAEYVSMSDGPDSDPETKRAFEQALEQALMIDVRCMMTPEGRRAVVAVVTRDGLPNFLKSSLALLRTMQEEFKGTNGRYAATPGELGYLAWNVEFPLQIELADGGWQATASWEGMDAVCQVAVGKISRLQRTGDGTPTCLKGQSLGAEAGPRSGTPGRR